MGVKQEQLLPLRRDSVIEGIGAQFVPNAVVRKATKRFKVAGKLGKAEMMGHRLDRSDGRRRHRKVTESKSEQSHGIQWAPGHFTAERQRDLGGIALLNKGTQECQRSGRKRIVTFGKSRIATIVCKEELEKVIASDGKKVAVRKQGR